MTPHPNAILRLFWRHHRQSYVPLTRGEIHASLKSNPDEVDNLLRSMTRDGLLASVTRNRASDMYIYDATEHGKAAHRAMMMHGAGS